MTPISEADFVFERVVTISDERKREEAKAAEGGGDGEEHLADDEVGEPVALRRERRAHRALVYGEELSGEQPRDRPHADAE